MLQKINKLLSENAVYFAWFFATTALFGSLILSEIAELTPCNLCWWQRIFMYPLVFIFSVGILRKDKNVFYYALPLSIVGMVIAFYHSLLQWGIIKESFLDCSLSAAVSCTNAQINWLGFITIPFMSFVCFTVITLLSWFTLRTKAGKSR